MFLRESRTLNDPPWWFAPIISGGGLHILYMIYVIIYICVCKRSTGLLAYFPPHYILCIPNIHTPDTHICVVRKYMCV